MDNLESQSNTLSTASNRSEMLKKRFKECPFCSKPISISASVCRHCRRNLAQSPESSQSVPEQEEFLQSALSDIEGSDPKMPSVEDIIEEFPVDEEPAEADSGSEESPETEGEAEEEFQAIEEGDEQAGEIAIEEEEAVEDSETEEPSASAPPVEPPAAEADSDDEETSEDASGKEGEKTGFFDNLSTPRNLILIVGITLFMLIITIINILIFTTILGGG